ncbi:4'-phosphopantetheinyl transferase superfamily protein [Streptomyces ferrugineus]|uniref:4'-phosphopantetheinyl transferase superfamily protein n=1 Tax=Streptomyces ferrugineus TaxID=1413221 RepID=A0A7M2SIY5_9ACTN|nr:4'-phosphopantetheinyl transferase superfamily protein [Streptomyces ferrugineus]QOV35705.1 4'-phosphopantetheinyl transferase superfamily protein [Streptomyces ferrugineus]
MPARIAHPLTSHGTHGPWEPLRSVLADTGSVVVHGSAGDWLPGPEAMDGARRILGRDWRRYESLPQPRLRERFVASRLLLRCAAAAALETEPHLVDLAYQPGGRPYVRGCDQIDVSLSHTEDMLVVGITRCGRIGVDVERADRRLAGTGSELHACTPFEKEQLDAGGEPERNDSMVRLWTLKEAYSKALGQGLRFRFTEFGFDLSTPDARLVRPDGSAAGGPEWAFATFRAGERYVVSVAVHDEGFGEAADVSVGTALDQGLLDALFGGSPGEGPEGPG